jgi:hypothetical protein
MIFILTLIFIYMNNDNYNRNRKNIVDIKHFKNFNLIP